MKSKRSVAKAFALAASALVWCALSLHAQSAPTITTQPVSQTNLVGSNVTFSVVVTGSGPFTYQWQFNSNNLPNNIITTMAGNGSSGYSGDNCLATNTSLWSPEGVGVDTAGNVYIADFCNQRIRRVDTNGIITTVAGNGNRGYSGDGGMATNAALDEPTGVAVDAFGNIYIADYSEANFNEAVRKVGTNGIITAVTPAMNSAGLAFDAS
ncbi:MAG: hypothetical protein ABSA47_17575, partial [Verrucomicrobiota bacterium]